MYANFYKDNKCLYSVEVTDEHSAEHLADQVYASDNKVNDWTITNEPIGDVRI